MPVQILKSQDAPVLRNPGKDSEQLLSVDNAPDALVTITRVTMQPGAVSQTHSHDISEQVWLVERGSGALLLADGEQTPIGRGDVVRTPPRTVHGIENTGSEPLVYVAITAPPEDMAGYYAK